MPHLSKDGGPVGGDDLDIASRVMGTVQKQIESYRISLEKVRALRSELKLDRSLDIRAFSSPEEMLKLLTSRGIPKHLAAGMVVEDFQDARLVTEEAIWTWDCCCTSCCITSCMITNCIGTS